MSTTYQIAEVADRSGFSAPTLRYYEDIGLVRPVGRTDAGYRLYDDTSLQRLRFIARAKQLGCTLDEIAELSTAWDGRRCAHVQERLRATVAAKITDSQRRIAEMTALTADLRRAAAALSVAPATGACDDTCVCTTDPTTATAPATLPVPIPMREGPPVACTLDESTLGTRVQEWSALLDGDGDRAGVTARTAVDGGVRLELGPGTDLAGITRLAAAEQDCCRFFRFTISIDARGVALEVRAPADAGEIVTALFGAPA